MPRLALWCGARAPASRHDVTDMMVNTFIIQAAFH
jgi:hypothetical protein